MSEYRDRKLEKFARKRVFDKFFKIDEVEYDLPKFDGGAYKKVKRLIFERGDSAAALVHDTERDEILLIEQFRAPTYEKGPGWIIETPAGVVDYAKDGAPDATMRRELEEEIGYKAEKLDFIARYFVSPGGTSERIFLYYAPVTAAQLINNHARGLAAEGEDIRTIRIPLAEFFRRLDDGNFEDAKVVIGGLWLRTKLAK
jgi:ADP-ribose pyrophosphatase